MRVGQLRHLVTLDVPGAPVADDDGAFTQTFTPLSPPTVPAEIVPATARDLERRAAGTVVSMATHVIRMRYHAGITTQTRITFRGRTFNVVGVTNLGERNLEMEVMAVEVVT